MKIIQSDWPEHRKEVPANLQLYFPFREELSILNGLIFKTSSGDRKDKREYYASSPQEPHGTAGMFAKSTGSRLLARTPHRLGEVSVTVRTVSDI